jgi:hypothetical protein
MLIRLIIIDVGLLGVHNNYLILIHRMKNWKTPILEFYGLSSLSGNDELAISW